METSEKNEKYVIIINGCGGVGKDTVCQMAGNFWDVQTISSITPIAKLAYQAGWNGQKTQAARRFLCQLKQACIEFNDLPFRYCMEQYQAFQNSGHQILFVHIREPHEIERFRQAVGQNCFTMLVCRTDYEESIPLFHNSADDDVKSYDYDGILHLDMPQDEMPEQVHQFICELCGITQNQGIKE